MFNFFKKINYICPLQKCMYGVAGVLAFNKKSFYLFPKATEIFKCHMHTQKILYTKNEDHLNIDLL